jgi:hypothetical protein
VTKAGGGHATATRAEKSLIKLILLGQKIREKDGVCGHVSSAMHSTYPANLEMYCHTQYRVYRVLHYILYIYSIFQVAYSILPDPKDMVGSPGMVTAWQIISTAGYSFVSFSLLKCPRAAIRTALETW